jgi:hypothetical protein
MPSANVFDDCFFKGEDKGREKSSKYSIWWSVTPELKNQSVIPQGHPHRGNQSKIVIGIAVIPKGHQTKFVITYGVIRSAVIATPLHHPSKKVITSGVIATCCVKKKSPTVAEDFPLNLNQNS